MGLLDAFNKQKRDLQNARRRFDTLPTPLRAAQLIERLVEAGEPAQADGVLEAARKRFPSSELLLGSYRHLRKLQLQDEMAALRRQVDAGPNPVIFSRLAGMYVEVGDHDKATDLCQRAIELFPDHEGPYLILARIRHERWKLDRRARDGITAVEFYRKAVDRNTNSYRTLLTLCELFLEIGARRDAIETAQQVLYFSPDDDYGSQLLRKAESLDPTNLFYDHLFREHEERRVREQSERGRLRGAGSPVLERLLQDPATLTHKLAALKPRIEGFVAALAIDDTGLVLAQVQGRSERADAVGQTVGEIVKAAQTCSYMMDVGSFRRAVVESPQGVTLVLQFEGIFFAVLASPQSKPDRLEEELTDLVENEVYLI